MPFQVTGCVYHLLDVQGIHILHILGTIHKDIMLGYF